MVQGTTSNAGKSFTAAGLCRILRQDGYRVAPFKSQNMSLNSYVTEDGLEMGRAQVMQAEAAGIAPTVLMNPILLKPTGDMRSQVVVMGTSIGQMNAREYYARKHTLRPIVQEAYDTLAAQYDIIVLEGAGSPAEINLKTDDFVNMGMAKMANAPVLLVGDINPGGVFAALYGTLALLDADERARVAAMIINKFRGDETILTPGLRQLEALTGVPVLGVVPFMSLDLDDEDSLSDRLDREVVPQTIDIAVVRLPHISNFTDFNPLQRLQNVSLRYVDSVRALGRPDLIILPGSKSTMDDLDWLRRQGLAAHIARHAGDGHPVLGICGGFQMLGRTLSDPLGVERGGHMDGLALLPVKTVFAGEKTRRQVQGRLPVLEGCFAALTNASYSGYEIHMGETEGPAQQDNIWGTYLHGLFDRPEIVAALIHALCAHKHIPPLPIEAPDMGARAAGRLDDFSSQRSILEYASYKEKQYDLLADGLRKALNMRMLYTIIEKDWP